MKKTQNIIMRTLKKAQKDREKFLYTLLKYASKQKEFNPHFFLDEMLEILNIDEGKFNKIQKSLGDQYCSYVDYINEKKRFQIYTSDCWHLHDKFEDWKLNNKLKNFTIVLIVVAVLAILIALPQSIESIKRLPKKSPVIDVYVESPIKRSDNNHKQKASNAIKNKSEPNKPNGNEKPLDETKN